MRAIDAENFDVFYFDIPQGTDADSFGLGVELVLERIDNAPTLNTNIPIACQKCSNHPNNGGSGISHCILGSQIIW